MNNRSKRKGMEISSGRNINEEERDRDILLRSNNQTEYPPLKTTIAASILFLGGIILLLSGFIVFFKSSPGGDTGISLIACGGISKYL